MLNKSLLKSDELYIVGVSGGCDSMCLLDLLVKNHYKVIVAHVNYNVREDTDEDYKVVKDYCDKHDILFHYLECHEEDYKNHNFQSIARSLRYDFYHKLYTQYNADGVVLAHHLDDVLETIYMYFDRQSLSDYIGMKEISCIKDMTIIRPLLDVKKEDIRDYCLKENVLYHDDYTNFQTHYFRDYVRNKVLVNYTDDMKQDLLFKAKQYNEDYAYKMSYIQPLLDIYNKQGYIDVSCIDESFLELFLYHICVNREIDVSKHLIQEIIHQIKSNKPNIQYDISIHDTFIKAYHNISIISKQDKRDYCVVIHSIEEIDSDHFKIRKNGPINNGIPVNKDDFPITIRNRQPGDIILTTGGTKKVNKLFIDKKIPGYLRDTYPLVFNKNHDLLLIPNVAKRKGYLTSNPTLFVLL